jgi:hypothetical protein
MLQEHVPDWISATEAWQWLSGPGRQFIPLWNHAWALIVEVCFCVLIVRLMPTPGGARTLLVAAPLATHLIWFMGTAFLLDGGVTYYYGSMVQAIGALTFAAMVFGAKWQMARR